MIRKYKIEPVRSFVKDRDGEYRAITEWYIERRVFPGWEYVVRYGHALHCRKRSDAEAIASKANAVWRSRVGGLNLLRVRR